jgi:hypothetical protein
VTRIPVLHTADGVEFDKARVVLYAYRYAQRHADAGVPIDVLRELMSHRKFDTTARAGRARPPPRSRRPRRRHAVRPARPTHLA